MKEDKHGDQVQALSVALSQVRKQETLLAEHVRRWESELITVRKTARAELDALWSSRIYAFMCRVCAFVSTPSYLNPLSDEAHLSPRRLLTLL